MQNFTRKVLECTVGVQQENIVLYFIMGKVRMLPLKVRSGSLNAQWMWHICQFQCFGRRYRLFPWIKS